MGQLMNDIVSTADAFTSNFSDKGPFDYSIEVLCQLTILLEELSDYEWDEDNLYSLESYGWMLCFLKQPGGTMAENTVGQKRNNNPF